MKKAFDANVSRARPRLRLGALMTESQASEAEGIAPTPEVESLAAKVAQESVHLRPTPPVAAVVPDLKNAVKARAEASQKPKPTMLDAIAHALAQPAAPVVAKAKAPVAVETEVDQAFQPMASPVGPPAPAASKSAMAIKAELRRAATVAAPAPVRAAAPVPVASIEAPEELIEVQRPSEFPVETREDPGERREKLKERLKAVRENPRPEPLPETVAEAGVLAVERISVLQTELVKLRAVNLALTQDLESSRRQAERATEEARLRMDEARRISTEMDARAKLLQDLERELASLEGERNDSLVALQETRQALEMGEREKEKLTSDIAQRDQALEESLAEEERLAADLESAHEAAQALRRSADALRSERDTLARQVSDLTRERAELMEARKALEAVHRALSKAQAGR